MTRAGVENLVLFLKEHERDALNSSCYTVNDLPFSGLRYDHSVRCVLTTPAKVRFDELPIVNLSRRSQSGRSHFRSKERATRLLLARSSPGRRLPVSTSQYVESFAFNILNAWPIPSSV